MEVQPTSEDALEAAIRNVMHIGGMTYMYARNLIATTAPREVLPKISAAKTMVEVHQLMKGE